jgi:hypothetical protein
VTALRTRAEQRNVDDIAEASEKGVDRLTLLEIFMEMLSRCFPVEKFWATIISVPAGWKQGQSMGEAWPLVAAWAARMELVELLADWSLYMSKTLPAMARKCMEPEGAMILRIAPPGTAVLQPLKTDSWLERVVGDAGVGGHLAWRDGDLVDRDHGEAEPIAATAALATEKQG